MSNNTRSSCDADKLEPQLEAAVSSLRAEPIDKGAVDRVKARAANLLAESKENVEKPASPSVHRRRVLTLASLAAGILFVVGAITLWPASPPAFAAAMEQLKSTGAFRYTKLIYTDNRAEPIVVQVMVANDGRERNEMSGTVSIMDSGGHARLTLIEAGKTAIVPAGNARSDGHGQRQLKWLERLKSSGDEPDAELGKEQRNGVDVVGFTVRQGQHTFNIWVDAKSQELVEIEHDAMVEGSPVERVVMKSFKFNESFDESLFSFTVPDGYKTMQLPTAPALLPAEENIVAALRAFTNLTDGQFPKSIVDWGEWTVMLSRSGKSLEEITAISSRLGAILPFLTGLSKDDYEYLGAGKSTGDERTLVFWYRADNGEIRAIYNDLTFADMDEKDLPANLDDRSDQDGQDK